MSLPTAEQILRELHASLTLRKRPEDVAQLVQELHTAQDTDLDPTTGAALAIWPSCGGPACSRPAAVAATCCTS
ncbi:hypothetical protein GCM10010430_51980 [Kitasatospora cystarginea]|uniref:Uncharacterized protein n=1 Tax=Kitasatospora cystarginea TaxID=58350 RepID=A0ABP5RKQ4_9ACTN